MAELTVISLGAGVQSSTVFALAAEGALPSGYDPVDAAIFADTHSEPDGVYDWLNTTLEGIARKSGIELIRVSAGSLEEEMLSKDDNFHITAPLWVKDEGVLPRHCTSSFKIKPVRAEIRRLLNVKSGKNRSVDCLLGISTDEVSRIKPSGLDYITNRYPLIDLGWSRNDCIDYMVDEGYGEPPRSACVMCPYRSNAEWKELQTKDYGSVLRAIDFDHAVRKLPYIDNELFVHRSRRPLEEIDFRIGDEGSFMPEECSGFCGV